MAQTITEALAEIATIDKRIAKKASDILPYVARVEAMKDPFEKSGGSAKYLVEQRQSFKDLLERKIALREAIALENAQTYIIIANVERSVADWLVWKRECYGHEVGLLRNLLGAAQNGRAHAQQHNVAVVRSSTETQNPDDVVVNLDEQALIHEIEALEEQFGRLDGLLSLKNATTFVTV